MEKSWLSGKNGRERMKGLILFGVVLLCMIIAVVILVEYIKRKMRGFSREIFGTDSFTEGWKMQEEELSVIPASVSGMTRILEPQIQKDFPEFNWVQFKNKAEEVLRVSLLAITTQNMEQMSEASEALKEQVEGRILENQTAGVREVYERIRIHQTEIAKYEKKNGRCIVTLQSAVEHIHYKEKDGKILSGKKDLLEQTKYNMELMYIQNENMANNSHGVGLTCPNCGAPIQTLGIKRCEYCGSEVVPINMQVWSLQHFYEVTYQRV